MLASGADDWVAHGKVVVKGGVSLSGRQSLPHLLCVSSYQTLNEWATALRPSVSATKISHTVGQSVKETLGTSFFFFLLNMKVRLGAAGTAEQVLNPGNRRQSRRIRGWAVVLGSAPLSLGDRRCLAG